MERRKTTIFMAKKILICLVLLHCCIAAVSAAPTLISYGDYVNGTIRYTSPVEHVHVQRDIRGLSVCPVEDQLVGLWTNHALCPERNPAGITHGRKWG